MSKAFYVFKRLFSHLGGQMIVVWLLVTYVSYNLTYVFTIYHTHENIRFYAPDVEQMEKWAFFNGSSRRDVTEEDNEKMLDALNALPGVEQAAYCYSLAWFGPNYRSGQDPAIVNAYPSELLTALGIRDEQDRRIRASRAEGEREFPLWADYRLKGELTIGDKIPLEELAGKQYAEVDITFTVVGFLNKQNAVPRFSGIQRQPTLEDIMDLEGYNLHMVAVADGLEEIPGLLNRTSLVSCLRLTGPAAAGIDALDEAARQKGMGYCVSYQQILDRYDATEATLSDTYTSTVWFMLPMSVIGLIGVQALLFERLKRLSAVLNLCGMPVKSWLGGWLLLLAALLLLPLLLGFVAFVVLQRLNIVYPLAVGLPARLIFLLPVGGILYAVCFLSVLPTILSILHAKPIELMREAEQ